MPSLRRRRTQRRTPQTANLLKRLKRLNTNDGLAQPGEKFVTIEGENYLSLEGFGELLLNANLKNVHLPYFNPLRHVAVRREGGSLLFQGTSLQRAVLSNIGTDYSVPIPRNSALLRFVFRSSNLNGASFDNAHNCALYFKDCSLISTNFDSFHYNDDNREVIYDYTDRKKNDVIQIDECDASKAKFTNSIIHYIRCEQSNLEKASFSNSDMRDGEFTQCNLKNATFENTKVEYFEFDKCDLTGVDFSTMSMIENEEISLGFTHCKFVGTIFDNPDLLEYTTFQDCDLTGIDFGNTIISYDQVVHSFENCTKDGLIFPPPPPANYKTFIDNDNIKSLVSRYCTDYRKSMLPPDLANKKINEWDVSKVTIMNDLFRNTNDFNESLDLWNVSGVKNMENMFAYCTHFNQSLLSWDVRQVENMAGMFAGCKSFNQPLHSWKVNEVRQFHEMFSGCRKFNQPLDSWSLEHATGSLDSMFSDCNSFNQPLNSWNVENVTSMQSMFSNCRSFNQPLDNWKVRSVVTVWEMFHYCVNLNQNFDSWMGWFGATHASGGTISMYRVFADCDALVPKPAWSLPGFVWPAEVEEIPAAREWTQADYDRCDNDFMEYEDGEEDDPLFYKRDKVKEDPIFAEPLKTGKDMVVYKMYGSDTNNPNKQPVKQMCYNRNRVQDDFDRQQKIDPYVRAKLTDYFKIPIKKIFFDENGGFAKRYTRDIIEEFNSRGGKKKRNKRKTSKRRK